MRVVTPGSFKPVCKYCGNDIYKDEISPSGWYHKGYVCVTPWVGFAEPRIAFGDYYKLLV